MGADIHIVVQEKDKKSKEWHTILDTPDDLPLAVCNDRDYDSFGILAEVRSTHIKSIDSSRGLPQDFCTDNEGYHKGVWLGDHSFSYLTLAEIKRHKIKLQDCDLYLMPRLIDDLNQITFSRGLQDKDIRIVFGFDS